jgi:hypothetical protein
MKGAVIDDMLSLQDTNNEILVPTSPFLAKIIDDSDEEEEPEQLGIRGQIQEQPTIENAMSMMTMTPMKSEKKEFIVPLNSHRIDNFKHSEDMDVSKISRDSRCETHGMIDIDLQQQLEGMNMRNLQSP